MVSYSFEYTMDTLLQELNLERREALDEVGIQNETQSASEEKLKSPKKKSLKKLRSDWSEEEDKRLFQLYKEKGSTWSAIVEEFQGRTSNEIKNRFYSTLRRIATKKNEGNAVSLCSRRKGLLQYVDDAIEYGHTCSSKRGRKRKYHRAKEVNHDKLIKNNKSVIKVPCIISSDAISGTSTTTEELLIPFDEGIKTKNKALDPLQKEMKLPLGSTGSAFVPFNKSVQTKVTQNANNSFDSCLYG